MAAGIGLSVVGVVWMVAARSARTGQGCSSFAVLPFHEESSPDKRFIAAGLAQNLLKRLSEMPGIGLVSLESAARHRAAGGAPADLGADCVVEGKVSRLNGELRVHLAVADGATRRSFWEATYRRPASQLPELEAELARAVAGRATAGTDGVGARGTPAPIDSEAALLYLEAGHEFNRGAADGYRRSIELYQPVDSASAGLRRSSRRARAGLVQVRPQHVLAAERSHAAGESRGGTRLAPGFYPCGSARRSGRSSPFLRVAASRRIYGTAARHDRRSHTGAGQRNASGVLSLRPAGLTQASGSIRRARERDPLSVPLMIMSQFISLASRRYTEATQFGLKAVSREPNVGLLRALVGMNLLYSGREAQGLEQLNAGLRVDAAPAVSLLSAAGFARVGDTGQARRLLAKAKVQARRRYVCAYEVASVHAVLGEADEAFRWFDKAITDRCDCMVWLNLEPWLDRIRADPRFEQLIRRVAFK